MSIGRIILFVLGIFILVLIVLSSSRIIDSIKKRIAQNSQKVNVKNEQISVTPQNAQNLNITPSNSVVFKGSEIPNTGPEKSVYAFLAGGIVLGVFLRKKTI